jgi:hypothetical protein
MSNFILQILINIFAITVTHFVTKRRERWRFTQEIKQKHLNQIKEQVFQPILNVFNNRWLILLERRSIDLRIVKEEKKAAQDTVTPTLVSIEYSLANWDEPADLKSINPYLYKDASENHYKEIIKEYECFMEKAREYVGDCLSYAKEIKNQIMKKINLPEFNQMAVKNKYQEEWLDSNHLALFIVRKQVVTKDKDLSLSSKDIVFQPSILKSITDSEGNECAVCAKPLKIIETLNDILKKQDEAARLISVANRLKDECVNLKERIEELRPSSKLSGDCDYIKL